MSLISVMFKDQVVWPVLDKSGEQLEIRMYYDSDREAIENGTADYFIPDILLISSEHVSAAAKNADILEDRDMIAIRPPVATGILWKISKKDPLCIVEPVTGEIICQVEPGEYAEANARIIAASRALLNIAQGVYTRMSWYGTMVADDDQDLCQFIVKALRDAGVENVDDLYIEEDSQD